MEQQGSQTCHQQSGLDAQGQAVVLHQNGNQNRCAEHGEQVLQAQNQHPGHAQRACVSDGLLPKDGFLFLVHVLLLSYTQNFYLNY